MHEALPITIFFVPITPRPTGGGGGVEHPPEFFLRRRFFA